MIIHSTYILHTNDITLLDITRPAMTFQFSLCHCWSLWLLARTGDISS